MGLCIYSAGEDLLRGLLETFAIAVIGTFIAIICIPFAFLGAQNLIKIRPVTGITKFILSVIRVFPEIVMALIFIKAVGPGSFSGVLAFRYTFGRDARKIIR